jgi:hypothetical protein
MMTGVEMKLSGNSIITSPESILEKGVTFELSISFLLKTS